MVIRKLYFQDKVNVSSTIVLLFWNYIFTISMVYSTLYSGQQSHHFLYDIAVESSLFPVGRVRVDCQFLIHLQAGEFGSCFVTFWGLEKKLNKRIKQKSFHIF